MGQNGKVSRKTRFVADRGGSCSHGNAHDEDDKAVRSQGQTFRSSLFQARPEEAHQAIREKVPSQISSVLLQMSFSVVKNC